MRTISVFTAAALITVGLSACSSAPEKVSAQYVSPLAYQSYDCDQVSMELQRLNRRLISVTGSQKSAADRDSVAMGVGLVLFWPALFFLAGDDHAAELGRLKGEYEALESAAIQKKCDIANELEAAKKERESRVKKELEASREQSFH